MVSKLNLMNPMQKCPNLVQKRIYHERLEAWTDGESDAEKCETCGPLIRDNCSGEECETNEFGEEQLQHNLDQQMEDEMHLPEMQEDADAEESILITPTNLNITKVKLIARLEHICYFHQIGYRSRFFEESDREP
jgi:hypothetical protein